MVALAQRVCSILVSHSPSLAATSASEMRQYARLIRYSPARITLCLRRTTRLWVLSLVHTLSYCSAICLHHVPQLPSAAGWLGRCCHVLSLLGA